MALYEPDAGLLRTCFNLSNSVLPDVLGRMEFWFFFGVHISIGCVYRMGLLQEADDPGSPWYMPSGDLKVITTMTVFFQVFYTNQCFRRYLELFVAVRRLLHGLHAYTFDLRVHFTTEELRAHTRLSVRYLMASVASFMYDMQSTASAEDWDDLINQGLVTHQEKAFLDRFDKRERHAILLHWSGQVLSLGFPLSGVPQNILKEMLGKILVMQETQHTLVDTMSLPVPFQYFHLLNMMVTVNLLMWAYTMGVTNSAFATLAFFFAEVIFVGMLELAIQMSDPFGEDEVDFPVREWVAQSLTSTACLVECEYDEDEMAWNDILKHQKPLQTLLRTRKEISMDHMEQSSGHSEDSESGARSWFPSLSRDPGSKKGRYSAMSVI